MSHLVCFVCHNTITNKESFAGHIRRHIKNNDCTKNDWDIWRAEQKITGKYSKPLSHWDLYHTKHPVMVRQMFDFRLKKKKKQTVAGKEEAPLIQPPLQLEGAVQEHQIASLLLEFSKQSRAALAAMSEELPDCK